MVLEEFRFPSQHGAAPGFRDVIMYYVPDTGEIVWSINPFVSASLPPAVGRSSLQGFRGFWFTVIRIIGTMKE